MIRIWIAIIGALGVVAANVVTAFGPAVLSWGQKPEFATSDIYKDLRQENPDLEKTLSKQLLQRELYYTSRRTEVTFKRLEGDNVVIEVRNITKVRNGTKEPREYEHSVTFDDTVAYESVMFRLQSGQAISYDNKKLRSLSPARSPRLTSYKLPKVPVASHETLEIESQFTITKPNRKNETPLVTNRFINAPMTFLIRNQIGDPKFSYEWSSLAFDLQLPPGESDPTKPEMTVTIPGPLFSGQGLSLMWDTK